MNLFVMANIFFRIQDILIPGPKVVLNGGIGVFDVKGEMSWGSSCKVIGLVWLLIHETSSNFYANAGGDFLLILSVIRTGQSQQ